MPTTFADLKNEVYANAYGYARDQEQQTYLSTAINASATTVVVGDVNQISRGLLEIDDELMWVSDIDTTANSATIVPGWGRGYLGSTAASHSQNARVTSNPRFPRMTISRAINETILGLYPQLFGVAQTDLTWSAAQTQYELPAAADRVLSVRWEMVGPGNDWEVVRRWSEILDGSSNVNEIQIDWAIVPGRTVRVVYAKKLAELSADADTLVTTAGLAESARDVVVYGALWRLLMLSEAGRLQSRAMESSELNEDIPPGVATTTARRIQEMFALRVAEERRRLLERYPPSVHMSRR